MLTIIKVLSIIFLWSITKSFIHKSELSLHDFIFLSVIEWIDQQFESAANYGTKIKISVLLCLSKPTLPIEILIWVVYVQYQLPTKLIYIALLKPHFLLDNSICENGDVWADNVMSTVPPLLLSKYCQSGLQHFQKNLSDEKN